jgi:hypothetical protein
MNRIFYRVFEFPTVLTKLLSSKEAYFLNVHGLYLKTKNLIDLFND